MSTFSELATHFRARLNALKEGQPNLPPKLKEGHISDESQSVKWNREKVEAHNRRIDAEWQKRIQADHEAYSAFEAACKDLLKARFSPSVVQVCWNKAYEDGHHNGFETIAEQLSDLAEYTAAVAEAAKKDATPQA